MHEKLFSIQIFQYFCQIPPRVCTLVLFISVSFYQRNFYNFNFLFIISYYVCIYVYIFVFIFIYVLLKLYVVIYIYHFVYKCGY